MEPRSDHQELSTQLYNKREAGTVPWTFGVGYAKSVEAIRSGIAI
jgi:hypothetical protein